MHEGVALQRPAGVERHSQVFDGEAAAEFRATDEDGPHLVAVEVERLLIVLDLGVAVDDQYRLADLLDAAVSLAERRFEVVEAGGNRVAVAPGLANLAEVLVSERA